MEIDLSKLANKDELKDYLDKNIKGSNNNLIIINNYNYDDIYLLENILKYLVKMNINYEINIYENLQEYCERQKIMDNLNILKHTFDKLLIFDKFKINFIPINCNYYIKSKEIKINNNNSYYGTSLYFLNLCNNIESINISRLHYCADEIKNISGLRSLKKLTMSFCNLQNLNNLYDLPNLEILKINNNNISDLNSITAFKNLKKIYVGNNGLNDFSPLKKLQKLKNLYIFNNGKENEIDKLDKLINLYKLYNENAHIFKYFVTGK